jgi:hypothetical protein
VLARLKYLCRCATIDNKGGAIDVRGQRGCQKKHGVRDLVRLRGATEGHEREPRGVLFQTPVASRSAIMGVSIGPGATQLVRRPTGP